MKMQQLRYIVEIVNQNLNVTEAANALYQRAGFERKETNVYKMKV